MAPGAAMRVCRYAANRLGVGRVGHSRDVGDSALAPVAHRQL